MKRNILLVEPNYRNKYPPIGLMKIATYHRLLGDNVIFFKGKLKDFVTDQVLDECLEKLGNIDKSTNWLFHKGSIRNYLKTKQSKWLEETPVRGHKYEFLLLNALFVYSDYLRKKEYLKHPKFDRIYVTTLFTFYWKISIKTIEFFKPFVKDINELKIGGVMASLLPKEIEEETGIKVIEGLLDKPGVLDPGNDYIIDDLPLDYSILEEIDYKYPTDSAYFTFMTKGCTRKCSFCSVPKLEPTYKPKIPTKKKFEEIKEIYGEQRNLLLMDNNVLASPFFPDIIQEIKDMGFTKDAVWVEPNRLDIAIKNLEKGLNDKAYIGKSFELLKGHLRRMKKKKREQEYFDLLEKHQLIDFATTTKENLLAVYPKVKEIYEKYRNKAPKKRYVDFNQGTDCRYVTDEYMRLMSEIPIRPLRIAFDYLSLRPKYEAAVELAAKYGLSELSNYILYNFKDKPVELYKRLRVNVELNERLGIQIFSFPMKFIPLFGEEAKDRDYIGKHWNRKFIRAVQSVLNVTKGIVAPGTDFFNKAFGEDENSFEEILYMPENYIIYRQAFEYLRLTDGWLKTFREVKDSELWAEAKPLIERNDFSNIESLTQNNKVRSLLFHYTVKNIDFKDGDTNYRMLKARFDKLIRNDQAINLTLTYDFENTTAPTVRRRL